MTVCIVLTALSLAVQPYLLNSHLLEVLVLTIMCKQGNLEALIFFRDALILHPLLYLWGLEFVNRINGFQFNLLVHYGQYLN